MYQPPPPTPSHIRKLLDRINGQTWMASCSQKILTADPILLIVGLFFLAAAFYMAYLIYMQ
jgi:hypothetical protein